jgi:hypothetical protein
VVMCENLPVVDPEKITVPTIILRGHYDGIAGFADLIEFFKRPPNADKQFAMMRHMSHASLRLKNYRIIHHILACWFAQTGAHLQGLKTGPSAILTGLPARAKVESSCDTGQQRTIVRRLYDTQYECQSAGGALADR